MDMVLITILMSIAFSAGAMIGVVLVGYFNGSISRLSMIFTAIMSVLTLVLLILIGIGMWLDYWGLAIWRKT